MQVGAVIQYPFRIGSDMFLVSRRTLSWLLSPSPSAKHHISILPCQRNPKDSPGYCFTLDKCAPQIYRPQRFRADRTLVLLDPSPKSLFRLLVFTPASPLPD